jgi:hypothetical protein
MDHKNSLVPFSCTVVVPYKWAWIVGSYLLSFDLRLFHDEMVKGVRVPFFLFPLLFSIPFDLVKYGLSLWLVWCLLLF